MSRVASSGFPDVGLPPYSRHISKRLNSEVNCQPPDATDTRNKLDALTHPHAMKTLRIGCVDLMDLGRIHRQNGG